jgi:peptidyl-prolyl cis-trans isomerase D
MQEVLKRIGEGTPFEDLARYYSEGPTAQQGGEIGTFKRGDLTPDVEAAAFALAPGQVSAVLEGPAAFQIIQLVEKTGSGKDEAVRLRQIFMKVEAGGDTAEKVRLAAEEIRKSAESSGLAAAAQAAGVAVRTTPPFEDGPFVPGMGPFRAANLFAFASEVGRVSEPVYNNDVYYVMAVASRDSAAIEPFQSATPRVRLAVAKEKRLQLARAEAERYRGDVSSGLDALARRASREVRQTSLVSRSGSIPAVGRDSKLILAAFAAVQGATAGPVHTDFGSFYLRKEKMNAIDEERYLAEKGYYIRSLLTQRQEYLFNLWIQKQSEKASVKDMRPPVPEIQEAG